MFIALFFLWNLATFCLIAYDKTASQSRLPRIAEKTLLLLAFFFGGMGIYLGMHVFRHKLSSHYFFVGVPMLIIFNVILVIMLVLRN